MGVQALNNKKNGKDVVDQSSSQEEATETQMTAAAETKKKGLMGGWFSSKKKNGGSGAGQAGDAGGKEIGAAKGMAMSDDLQRSMPQTFEEMAKFQGTMVGANVNLINIIVDFFD